MIFTPPYIYNNYIIFIIKYNAIQSFVKIDIIFNIKIGVLNITERKVLLQQQIYLLNMGQLTFFTARAN